MIKVPELQDVDMAFSTISADTPWLPAYDKIPKEFLPYSTNKWCRFFDDMFFFGLESLDLTPKEGVDKNKALRALRAVASTFALKHEHKSAAFAYLASEWFEDVKYVKAERDVGNKKR